MSMSWMNKLNEELGVCFWRQFHAEPICLSEYLPDGKMLMWLRSRDRVILGPQLEGSTPNLTLPSPTLAKDDTVDVDANEVRAAQRVLGRQMSKRIDNQVRDKLLGLPDVIDI